MTRDEVLAEMEADFAIMNEEERNMFLFDHDGQEWTPNKLIVEVRNSTPMGLQYVESWSSNRQARAQLEQLVAMLMGDGGVIADLPPGVQVVDLGALGEEDDEDELPPIFGLPGRGESKPS